MQKKKLCFNKNDVPEFNLKLVFFLGLDLLQVKDYPKQSLSLLCFDEQEEALDKTKLLI